MTFHRKVSGIIVVSNLFFITSFSLINGENYVKAQETIIKKEASRENKLNTNKSGLDNSEIDRNDSALITNSVDNTTSTKVPENFEAVKSEENLAEELGDQDSSMFNASSDSLVNENSETVSETTSSQEESDTEESEGYEAKELKNSRQVRDAEITWTMVNTPEELTDVLKQSNPPSHIKLEEGGIFNLAGKRIPVKSDVVIDGNGRTISYDNFSLSYGIYADAANLNVTLQNMVFGSEDFSVPMNNLYGIFPSEYNEHTQLTVKNIKYYSDNGAQAFHNNGANATITFSGKNEFILKGKGQEFAQADKFYFEKDSDTKIVHDTESESGFIWSYYSSKTEVILEENAIFDVETNHSFIRNDNKATGGEINVGNNASLRVNSISSPSASNRKSPIRNKGVWDISVGESGSFDLSFPYSVTLGNGSNVYLGRDSSTRFNITEQNSVFDGSVGNNSTFTVDNANSVEFTAVPKAGTNPIGFVGGTDKFSFADFASAEEGISGTEGYAIRTNPQHSINSQKAAGTWDIKSGDINRAIVKDTENFSTDEQNALKNVGTIKLVKIPEPKAKISSLKKEVGYFDAKIGLDNYELYENPLVRVDFRLFSSEPNDPAIDASLSEKTISAISEEVTFENLEQDTEYWVYARIISNPSGQSSDWFKATFKTKAMINVEVPTYVAFRTDTVENNQQVIPERNYTIINRGTSPVDIKINSFEVKSNPGNIQLLTTSELSGASKGLFLQLENEKNDTFTLPEINSLPEKPLFSTIDGGSQEKLGLTGYFKGTITEVTNLDSQLTLLIEDPNVTDGGDE